VIEAEADVEVDVDVDVDVGVEEVTAAVVVDVDVVEAPVEVAPAAVEVVAVSVDVVLDELAAGSLVVDPDVDMTRSAGEAPATRTPAANSASTTIAAAIVRRHERNC
jgi:hypothetical protein